jgi:predicted dehydrogenase
MPPLPSPAPGAGLSRRQFAGRTALASLAVAAHPLAAAEPARRLRAAIIGHTGGGDYGHGYDRVFDGLTEVEVVAVADPDAPGRAQAQTRCGAARGYADYRELLTREHPDLVSIAFRHPRRHAEVALAALEAGAHLFLEKPLTETLADADRIVAAVERRRARTVVAHNRRYTPEFQHARALLLEGFVGRVREIHCHGKQDARAGGEDMMVLGTHDFDWLRHCFGDPLWCTATVLQDRREAPLSEAREGREPLRVLGDTVRARFGFPGNLTVTWDSVRTSDDWNQRRGTREHWALEVLGTQRVLAYHSGVGFACLDSPYLLHPTNDVRWQPLPPAQAPPPPPHQRHMGRDLVHAVHTGEPTLCSVPDGRWAVEMVEAVYQSHRTRSRVSFPLTERLGLPPAT